MNRRPSLDELVEGIEDPEERARLQRVHELLVETEAPPELSPTLATPPPASARDLPWQRPRRVRPRFVLVGAVIVTAFFIGFLTGSADSPNRGSTAGMDVVRTIQLDGEGNDSGAIGLGARDDKGNWSMVVTVWGLDAGLDGDYYTLALTKKGKPTVTCGTFNVSGRQTTVRMVAAYNLEGFDGWVVLRYDAESHDNTPVLRSSGV